MEKGNNERGEKMRDLFLRFFEESREEMDETIRQMGSCDANGLRGLEHSLRVHAKVCSSLYAVFAQVCDDFSLYNKKLLDSSCMDAFDSELDGLAKKGSSEKGVIKKLSEYRSKLIDFMLWN